MTFKPHRSLVVLITGLALAACAAPPPSPPTPTVPVRTPAQMLAAVRAAAQSGDARELHVQPLRDAQTQDLREQAAAALARGDTAAAARALDQALALVTDDPGLWQERAEVALAQQQWAPAESAARRAVALGSQVGPLCRRHWETLRQILHYRRELAAQPLTRPNPAQQAQQTATLDSLHRDIEQADRHFDACTVPGIHRM